MILSLKQQIGLNRIVELYAEEYSCDNVITDEITQYKNTEYENLMIGLSKDCKLDKHLKDYNVCGGMELTYYYQKHCPIFIQAWKVNYDNSLVVTVHKNMGKGLEESYLLKKFEIKE